MLEGCEVAVGRVLGRGFSTVTYRGSDPARRRLVTVKEVFPLGATRVGPEVHPSPSIAEADLRAACRAFGEEARAFAGVEHPGLPRVYGVFEENHTAYEVLEMLEGITLAGLLARRGVLPEAEALSLVARLADALARVHEAGLAHCAVHPEHGMVTLDGRIVLISPAGASRSTAEALQRVAEGLVPGYAAPEQYHSHALASPATDVYSLAATAYHLLTGVVPVDAPSRLLGKEIRPAHEMVPTLSPRTSEALAHALEIDRKLRPGNVRDFLDLLVPRPVHGVAAAALSESQAVALSQVSAPSADVPPGLRFVARNVHGYDVYENEMDGMMLIHVPASTFRMGSDDGFENEQPAHEVVLESFFLGWNPVTNAQFERFVEETGFRTRAEVRGVGRAWNGLAWRKLRGACWREPAGRGSTAEPDLPVVQLAWEDAAAYCHWAGLRLPSEAEWELGARGPQGRTWPWGEEFDASACCSSVEEECVRPDPVGCHPEGVSPVGCLDMAGNVWEWCSSVHAPYPYDAEDGREEAEAEGKRVLRGGSWNDDLVEMLRGAYRDFDTPIYRSGATGFRCAAGGRQRGEAR